MRGQLYVFLGMFLFSGPAFSSPRPSVEQDKPFQSLGYTIAEKRSDTYLFEVVRPSGAKPTPGKRFILELSVEKRGSVLPGYWDYQFVNPVLVQTSGKDQARSRRFELDDVHVDFDYRYRYEREGPVLAPEGLLYMRGHLVGRFNLVGRSAVVCRSWSAPQKTCDVSFYKKGEQLLAKFTPHENTTSQRFNAFLYRAADEVKCQPALGNSTLYVGTRSSVIALSRQTGIPIWTVHQGCARNSNIIATDDAVVVVTPTQMISLDPHSGSQRWAYPLNHTDVQGPSVENDRVKISVFEGEKHRGKTLEINIATGQLIQSNNFARWGDLRSKHTSGYQIDQADVMLVNSSFGGLDVIDVKTQATRMHFQASGVVELPPVEHEGVVYFGTKDKIFYAYNFKTGEKMWQFPLSDVISTRPLIDNGYVYFGVSSGIFYALKAQKHKHQMDPIKKESVQ